MASPQLYLPPEMYIGSTTGTWGAGGNTSVVTDTNVNSTSLPLVVPTSTFAGRWWITAITPSSSSTSGAGVITVTAGSFTINSSSSENSAVTFSYKLQ